VYAKTNAGELNEEEDLFFILVFRKKGVDQLFIAYKYSVNSVKQEGTTHNTEQSFIQIEVPFCKKQEENAATYIEHHHENPENGINLLKNPVIVHNEKLITNKRKISLISKVLEMLLINELK